MYCMLPSAYGLLPARLPTFALSYWLLLFDERQDGTIRAVV